MNYRVHCIWMAKIFALLPLLLLVFSSCANSSVNSQVTAQTTAAANTAVPSATATAAVLPTATGASLPGQWIAIKVYFSKTSDSAFNAVFPVNRMSPTIDVGTYSIQELVAGPTLDERSQGYYSELNNLFTGPSICKGPAPNAGPDFTLTLNMRGSKPETGVATLQLCRPTASPGIGTDARVESEISTTLLQFLSIKQVVILTYDGHCFGDESGLDMCLQN